MICSVPLSDKGYAYFQCPQPPFLRQLSPNQDEFGIPIEEITPLLPIGSQIVGSGRLAKGIICYPQNQTQAIAVSSAPSPEEPTAMAQESGLLDGIFRGIVTTLFLKGLFL